MRELADDGNGLLLFSSDLAEIVGLCDRALVMYEGRIVRELIGAEIDEANIVAAALNLDQPQGAGRPNPMAASEVAEA